jgi:hypothetical protein
MYSIFFHIGGIAILEICFYFFYIGPMESIIFQRKIRKLLDEPSQKVNMFLQSPFFEQQASKEALSYFMIQEMKVKPSNQSFGEYLYQKSQAGYMLRKKLNDHLFYQALQYWGYFIFFSFFYFFVYCKYERYNRLQKENGITSVLSNDDFDNSDPDIELIHMPLYRKGSETSEELVSQISRWYHCNKKKCKKVLHYFAFGCCILAFQFFFFECIVSKYEPLSNEELNYIIYEEFEPIIYEFGIY